MIADALTLSRPATRLRHANAAFAIIPAPAYRNLASTDPDIHRDALAHAAHACLKAAIQAANAWSRYSAAAPFLAEAGDPLAQRHSGPDAELLRGLLVRQLGDARAALGSGFMWHDPDRVIEALRVLRPVVGYAAELDFERWRGVELLVLWTLGRADEVERVMAKATEQRSAA